MLGVNASVASDHESDGQSENSSIQFADLCISHHNRVVDFELPVKVVNGFRTIVHGNANHLETLVSQLVLQFDELRDLIAARFAPSCPEVQKNYLPSII